MADDAAIRAEAQLAEAVASGDDARAIAQLHAIGRDALEFTGRCYALAITQGMVEASLEFACADFHLNVMDEPAVRTLLAGHHGTRALRTFLTRYGHAHAKRTYYLDVVQAPASRDVLAALLEAGVGLSAHDESELLSLAVRADDVELAALLAGGGARLVGDIHEHAPAELQRASSVTRASSPWQEALKPTASPAMIGFIASQLQPEPCRIRREWFSLYARDARFASGLALIARHSAGDACESIAETARVLAGAGRAEALAYVLSWPQARGEDLHDALRAAQDAGATECAALLVCACGASPAGTLEALDW